MLRGGIRTLTEKEEAMPSKADKIMLAEILNQPEAWAATPGDREFSDRTPSGVVGGVDEVVFTDAGRASTPL